MYSTFAESINKALHEALKDPKVLLMGEGVPDPKRIFGTTRGLKEAYPNQVFDQPVSENGATGILIGASLNGYKTIQTHQRIDFSLYAMDQIINNAAKWKTMFGYHKTIPMVIRMIVGRGWGQGVQHSQNLEALYAHIPGLRVFIPHDSESAYRLLLEAIADPDPVIFIEHKWLYSKKTLTYKPRYKDPKLTILSWGAAASEVEIAIKDMDRVDHIVLEQFNPCNRTDLYTSLVTSKKLLVVSDDWERGGIAAEMVAHAVQFLPQTRCHRLSYPHTYIPASPRMSKEFYPEARDIVKEINRLIESDYQFPEKRKIHDVDPFSTGPTSAI